MVFKKILRKIAREICPLGDNVLATLGNRPMPIIGDAGRENEIDDELNEWIKRRVKALRELTEEVE